VQEQRKSRRFDLKLPFELICAGAQPGSLPGETRNLSSNGVLFCAEARIAVGDRVEYVITLPTSNGEEWAVRLRCLGKVVRNAGNSEIAATLERYEFIRK
jgi:PilZ domain-containing protein